MPSVPPVTRAIVPSNRFGAFVFGAESVMENSFGLFVVASNGGHAEQLEVNAVCSRTGTASRRPATTRLPPISRTDQTTSKMVLIAAWFPCPRAGSLRGATVAQACRPGAQDRRGRHR